VYAFFSFVGAYLFYRAFRLGYPEGDAKRYRLLVFFFPSLVFWPAGMGKEGWMIMVLGACAFGTANLVARRARGVVWLGLGLWGTAVVRPHIALAVLCGLFVAVPLIVLGRRTDAADGLLERRMARIALVGLLVIGTIVIFAEAQKFLGIDDLSVDTAEQAINQAGANTAEGRSAFTPPDPTTPIGYVEAVITVTIRPFPFEVTSAQGALAGAEGLAMLLLLYASLPRLLRIPLEVLRRPYIAFALVFASAFIFAFSSIANFGILTRERTQLLPVMFILLAIPRRGTRRRWRRGREPVQGEREPELATVGAAR
jgi:hypothetical protein